MAVYGTLSKAPITRRRFLIASACAGAGLALYGGEIERHWIEVTHRDVFLPGLPQAFDGFRVAQLSDIHLDDYTEPYFLRDAVRHINSMNPDAVFLTGDFVTRGLLPRRFSIPSAWQCANLLNQLECPHRYAVLGNHDVLISRKVVTEALSSNAITVLDNAHVPIERAGARFWLAGLDDPLEGTPNPELANPSATCRTSPSCSFATHPIMSTIFWRRRRAERSRSCSLVTRTEARYACRSPDLSFFRRWAASMSRAGSALEICNSTSIAVSAQSVSPFVSTARQRLRFSRSAPYELESHPPASTRLRSSFPRDGHAPAIVIPSMRSVGEATDPRKTRSFPIAVTLRSISARFPAIVTSSTACVSCPFSIHRPVAPRE